MLSDKPMITVKELEKRYHISHDKAYSLIHNKDFPSLKINGRYYVRVDLLIKWEERQIAIQHKCA